MMTLGFASHRQEHMSHDDTWRELTQTSARSWLICLNVVEGSIPPCNFNRAERVWRPEGDHFACHPPPLSKGRWAELRGKLQHSPLTLIKDFYWTRVSN